MISKILILTVLVFSSILCSIDCDELSSSSVTDRICPTGGDYACRFYCFLTTGSFVGHCDDNKNCICGTPSNIQNKNENSDQEIIIIVEN